MEERLQKFLASQGIASRRKCEEYIEKGLVTINDKIAKLGDKIDTDKDVVKFNGKVIENKEKEFVYILLNKPIRICYNCKRSIPKGYSIRFNKSKTKNSTSSEGWICIHLEH